MQEDNLSKAELQLIDKIVGALSVASFRDLLWSKVSRAFGFMFRNTQIKYGFTHATPDPLALKYLEDRVFILSDKTRDRLTGNLRWELLEGIRNVESISEIKKRLEPIFTRMHDYEIERIARTETLNAMNAGRLEAYEASEVTHYKMWRAAINNKRTAADSRRLHGQIQELSDPFVDPKTGDAVMHPPNRPNCRCAMIPLRKLPENVVRKGGQMYAADEMVGKIEFNIGSLSKTEKRIWIKPTSKRKGHYRKIKGAKKVEEKYTPAVAEHFGPPWDLMEDKLQKIRQNRGDVFANNIGNLITATKSDGNEHAVLLDSKGNRFGSMAKGTSAGIPAEAMGIMNSIVYSKQDEPFEFIHTHPHAWALLSENDIGQLARSQGMYTMSAVSPTEMHSMSKTDHISPEFAKLAVEDVRKEIRLITEDKVSQYQKVMKFSEALDRAMTEANIALAEKYGLNYMIDGEVQKSQRDE